MTFDISFQREQHETESLSVGEIRLGDFAEYFESSLEFWKMDDYQSHWYRSIRRVVDQRKNSCLISSITNPQSGNFIFWWPIYVMNDASVIVQNQVLFLKECEAAFDLNHPHESLRPRETVSEEGETISEWQVSITDLEAWLFAQAKGGWGSE